MAETQQQPHEGEAQKVERDRSPTWMIRLAMAIIGVLLILGALIAWQMHWAMSGFYGTLLPWVIVLAVLLGAGAVIESIKTSVWITLLIGIFLVIGAYFITGRYVVNLDASAHAVFVVDRFSGETHYCDQDQCRTLSEGVSAASLKNLKLPFGHHH
jgi:hypothetical protein